MDEQTDTNNEPRHLPRDRKERRITLRLTEQDLARILEEASRESITVAAVVRRLVRAHLPQPALLKQLP